MSKSEGMMFKRIDHVEIVTDRLERTVEFYTEVLGGADARPHRALGAGDAD
jgi:catechol 2,3-dioxygenase-like lactoylglutathione lyase family enzyme